MEQIKIYSQHLFPELIEALKRGYDKHFSFNANGLIKCLSNPTKYYDFHEVKIDEMVICILIPATLYLISTVDGLHKGTAIEFLQDHV